MKVCASLTEPTPPQSLLAPPPHLGPLSIFLSGASIANKKRRGLILFSRSFFIYLIRVCSNKFSDEIICFSVDIVFPAMTSVIATTKDRH